jgi:hypothetical protein
MCGLTATSGDRVVDSAKEFRAFALECLRWADETREETHRQILLDLATQWMQAALAAERSIPPVEALLAPNSRQ